MEAEPASRMLLLLQLNEMPKKLKELSSSQTLALYYFYVLLLWNIPLYKYLPRISSISVYKRLSVFLFLSYSFHCCHLYMHFTRCFPCTGNLSQESAFHRPAASSPSQRCSLRNSPRWSSARYRGLDGPQQGLHTPVPVVLKYYTAPSNVVAPTPPMCYRWKMFADHWSALAPDILLASQLYKSWGWYRW